MTGAQRADEQLGFEFVRSQQIDIRVPAEGDAGILGAVNILFVDRRDQVQRSDFLQRQAVTVLFDVDRILVNLLERVRRVGEESKDRLLEAVGVEWMIQIGRASCRERVCKTV